MIVLARMNFDLDYHPNFFLPQIRIKGTFLKSVQFVLTGSCPTAWDLTTILQHTFHHLCFLVPLQMPMVGVILLFGVFVIGLLGTAAMDKIE